MNAIDLSTERIDNKPISRVYCMDRLEFMRQLPDSFFDLVIDDPPYFSGPEKRQFYGMKQSKINVKRLYDISDKWEVPGEDYFKELYRVSKHQIVWGCNYYNTIYPGPGRIVWDKVNGSSSFSDCEIAYCSKIDSVRMVRYMWNGMMQGKSLEAGYIQQGNKSLNEKRIHPTQKPVQLYLWQLKKFAKKGDKIGDFHAGSQSSRIAAFLLGLDYWG